MATPAIAPHKPMARARSLLSVKTLEISDSVAGNVIAAPSPITDRAAMSCAGLDVKPPARLAVPNTASPASSMPLRPNRSDRLPKVSSSAAKTRLKESTTHCSWVVVACSSRTRAGSATFTSVVSRLTRNAASSSATRIMDLDRIVLPPEWVVPAAVTGRRLRGSAGPYCRAARREFRSRWRAISCITYGCIDVGPSPGDPPGGGTVSTPSRQAGEM